MAKQASSGLLENVKTIVYAGLIAVGIRTIAFEPFNIPSGSMKPTLLVGDYLFVSKYSYGYSHFSMPFSPNLFEGRLLGRVPDRGDVAVFRWPRDDRTDYIKRIVGLPGDRIQMRAGQLYLNGEPVPQRPAGTFVDDEPSGTVVASMLVETLPGDNPHQILKRESSTWLNNTIEYRVPPGHVFAMGDNRDNSQDSRVPLQSGGVGFVPLENLIGRAEFIFFSVDSKSPWWQVWNWPFEVRWSRLLHGVS